MHRDYDRRAYASSEELEAYDALTRRLNEQAVAAMRAELGSGRPIQLPESSCMVEDM